MRNCTRVLWGSVVLWMWAGSGFAGPCVPLVARVVSIQGIVEVKRLNQFRWLPVKLQERYCAGDMLRTGLHSRAAVLLSNGTKLRLDQETTLVLPQLAEEERAWLELLRGAIHFISNLPYHLKVKTPFVNAAIEGTEFAVRVSRGDTRVWVLEGRVSVENPRGRIVLDSGQAAVAESDKAPVPYLKIKPDDAVQWALYYPPILDYRPEAFTDPQLQRARELYGKGRIPAAFEMLESVPENTRGVRFYSLRAALLLAVGQVGPAENDLNKALALSPGSSVPIALQAIIELTLNNKTKARALVNRAVRLEPNSPAAWVALSYVLQAEFDLEGAKDSVQKALDIAPEDALAWARLSELELSVGDLEKALEAARKAEALNPDVVRTQVVLGFAYLLRIELDDAAESFRNAIALDSAAPLPRLGMGLTKIHAGDVKGGTENIEIAAILDPGNSLIRSYLGKAYYEERRGGVVRRELELAKKLDPKDPTPWFYDAIYKQTVNRPIEALKDQQKSIDLNENRAIYRSKFLMDTDLAARSASLARIYGDSGFGQRGLLEGWLAVNHDPTNYSAHRFLADSYSVLQRHEIARVSELLQSQLLQPLNINPIQPQLGERNLFILGSLGPDRPSFNEFNPIFARNGFRLQSSGIVGSQNTLGDQVVQSGIWDRFSYSLGQYYYQTDGFRENNSLVNRVYNAFVQTEVTPKTGIQAEYRYGTRDSGDLTSNFFGDFSPALEQKRRSHNARFGFRHDFTPQSTLIGHYAYQSVDFEQQDTLVLQRQFIQQIPITIPRPFPLPPLTVFRSIPITVTVSQDVLTERHREGHQGEIQHLFNMDQVDIVSGVSYITQQVTQSTRLGGTGQPGLAQDDEISNLNIYAYSQLSPLQNLGITLGLGGTFLELHSTLSNTDLLDRSQANPKFGVIWQPFDGTVLRGAALRGVSFTPDEASVIEPTQVAGFNQFYDDPNGTDAWLYGLGLDQRVRDDLFAGIEAKKRVLNIPQFSSAFTPARTFGERQETFRAYLYWAPFDLLSLTAEYFYEHFKRDQQLANGFTDLKTHTVPLALNVFHPSGLGFRFKTSFVDQSGTFIQNQQSNLSLRNGQEQFWVADTEISFRFPKRYGIASFAIRNLFDTDFRFQNTDRNGFQVVTGRAFFSNITLAF